MKRLVWFLIGLVSIGFAKPVDIVVFSYNRPLQLYAFLESLEHYGTGVATVSVLYRSSDALYESGYQKVKDRFSDALFFRQKMPGGKSDFRSILMRILAKCPSEYIAFAVDDLICKDEIDFEKCCAYIEKENAEAFHLRLGLNLDYCYTMNMSQPSPKCQKVGEDIYRWTYSDGVADWNYPHTVDMSVFSRKQVIAEFQRLEFSNPNTLESAWMSLANYKKKGLFFKESRVVNFPLNLVNTVYQNRHMKEFPPEQLLELFLDGYKMDLLPLDRISNQSAHMEYFPTFTSRDLP